MWPVSQYKHSLKHAKPRAKYHTKTWGKSHVFRQPVVLVVDHCVYKWQVVDGGCAGPQRPSCQHPEFTGEILQMPRHLARNTTGTGRAHITSLPIHCSFSAAM